MNISIFGLGYVGVCSAACFAKMGHNVIGIDITKYKIDCINRGKSPVYEKGIDKLVKTQVKSGRLKATSNIKEAIMSSDISFICVGTPPKKNGDADISTLKKVLKDIVKITKDKPNHIIVIRSTIFPGTLKLLKNIIKDSKVAVNPEFLREGTAIEDFFNPPFILIGSDNLSIATIILSIYSKFDADKFIVSPNTAQMIKYTSNSFHALKISFTNEISSICKRLNIDSKQVMQLFCEDKQLNISSYYLKPGFSYGGSCLPKDLAALNNNVKRLNIKCPIINSISKSNNNQIERAVKLIESIKSKSIGIIGLAFKADTDDVRGNPVILVINKLANKGYNIKIFDKDTNNIKSICESYRKEIFDLVNKSNMKNNIKDISTLFSDIKSTLKQDIIIISKRDRSLIKYISKLKSNQYLIDLQNIFGDLETKASRLFC